jgi:hypothetical protein
VDFLFEKQLRSKEPNEVIHTYFIGLKKSYFAYHFKYQSLKLWLILYTLRELLKRVEEDMGQNKQGEENELEFEPKLALNFALILLNDRPEHLVRHNEEQFIRQAIAAFPYKQSVSYNHSNVKIVFLFD